MNLDQFKKAAKTKKSRLEEERIASAIDYDIPDIGIIKIAKPLPQDIYNIIISNSSNAAFNTDNSTPEDNMKVVTLVIKACSVDPVLDDEAVGYLIDIMGLDIQVLANKCFELIGGAFDNPEGKDVENFSEQTDGPTNEPPPQ